MTEQLLFLPGAGGSAAFFKPLASLLAHRGARTFLAWPGFGANPPDPRVSGVDGLVRLVTDAIGVAHGVALVAQSMGGLLAIHAALARPAAVRRIVLTATSGGVDVARLGGADWRPDFRAANPSAPPWLTDDRTDLAPRLGEIRVPVLLVFGDADPISPVAVGRHLASLLPSAELIVIPGGDHMLAHDRAEEVAPHVDRFLARAAA